MSNVIRLGKAMVAIPVRQVTANLTNVTTRQLLAELADRMEPERYLILSGYGNHNMAAAGDTVSLDHYGAITVTQP
jgi:hypothetical protein